ncbi:YfcE family phosphodiesterase [Levilactobacillus brevis]|nr:YfcE family phosphodiesterase [Levilactobacillus brevis]
MVQGNMDFDSELPLVETPTVDGCKVLLTHGHYDAVHWDLTKLKSHADEVQADLVFFGHTHELAAEAVGEHVFVNPGVLVSREVSIANWAAPVRWLR